MDADTAEGSLARRIAELVELRGSLRQKIRVRRQQVRNSTRRAQHWSPDRMPQQDQHQILTAYWLTDFVCRDCLTLLEKVRCPPSWGPLDEAAKEAFVEDLFMATDFENLDALMDASNPVNRPRMRELWTLHAEWRAARWVQQRNEVHGVAPSSEQVYRIYLSWRRQAPADVQPRAFERGPLRRNWALRWRARWDGCMDNLKTGDLDPTEIIREKAVGHATFLGHRPGRSRKQL